ncbi:MAG TPA: DUF1501 domain-containing protein [Jatrophihabitantaceae bacterium]|jgi:uncharacterized protein (DUF1501 family)
MRCAEPSVESALVARAEQVDGALHAQRDAWGSSGWTRRRFIAGAGMVGTAALAGQFVTARASFATTPDTTGNTVVVVFMRGAADGLRILVPNSSDLGLNYLREVRNDLVPSADDLVALSGARGWAVNAAMRPLYDTLWSTGELGFVPGVSSPGVSRSHFQAQQYLEKGGSDTVSTGWLDRTLDALGPGTTFRAVAVGGATPMSLLGPEASIALTSVDDFVFPGWDEIRTASKEAVAKLYRGMPGTLGEDVPDTLAALKTAATVRAAEGVQNGADYPDGDFSQALQDIAAMLRAEVGLQVATIDVGGWDTHTDEANDLDGNLGSTAQALSAFMTDLGPARRKRVTVVVQTEFGRRVEMNASGGTDHGHGSVMWLLGGGLTGSDVFGKWQTLTANSLDDGDVPGVNNPFDVFGEVIQKRLGAGSLSSIFPGHKVTPIGLASSA